MKNLTIFIFSVFVLTGYAQEKSILEQEIINKLSFIKQNNTNREIVFKEKLFYDFKEEKNINPVGLTKDSLRHFLVGHGFYDFNFEYFKFNVKNLEELNESYIKNQHPGFNQLISDSSYNKVSFNYRKIIEGWIVDVLISKNFIEIDDVKEIKAALGVGYYKEELTFRGTSKVNNILYRQNDKYLNIVNERSLAVQSIPLSDENRFNITIDGSFHKSIYVAITNDSGDILSVIKMY